MRNENGYDHEEIMRGLATSREQAHRKRENRAMKNDVMKFVRSPMIFFFVGYILLRGAGAL